MTTFDFRDRRAEIIARLVALLPTLEIELSSGVIPEANFVHNRNELPAGLVPGVILLDADETKDASTLRFNDGRQTPAGLQLINMTPEIYVVLDVRKPHNENVGEDLNAARTQILAAIFSDETLRDICGSNGVITYDGSVTDLARNRTMQGQLGMSITFRYPLFPPELQGE